jgi:hypothetical protein
MKQYVKDFVHNAVVHPLMMILPTELATRMHDRNAGWAFGQNRYDEIGIEQSLGENAEEPDGYAVLVRDKSSAPKGYWLVGLFTQCQPAHKLAADQGKAGYVRPFRFLENNSE